MLDTIERPEADAETDPTGITALAVIPNNDALAFFTTEGEPERIIARLKETLAKIEIDLTTSAGRKRAASAAAKISTVKSMLEAEGKKLADDQKLIPKKIDAGRRTLKDGLDELRVAFRKPLTDWEDAEAARIDRHNVAIARITNAAAMLHLPAVELRGALDAVEAIKLGDECEEFLAEYALAKDTAIALLRPAIEVREKYEADQVELARLRAEDEVRKKREAEEAIRREGEERAKREADAKVEAAKAASAATAAAERQAAEQRELDLRRQVEAAQREAADTAARIDREAKEKAALEAAETAAREADRNHRAAVNRAALDALLAGGIAEDVGKAVITLIASKKVPGVSIAY